MMKTIFLGASLMAMVLAGQAMAQTAAAAPAKSPDAVGGDIVVTATRFETLASKTPIALTAVSGEGLRNAGITNPTALGDQVPSVMINRNNGLQITIRGVTSADGTEKGDPSAAFMNDGVYIARQQVQEVSFFDISRVEVLRGPQGTLYGRNTTAGAVNVISNRPDLSKFSGSVDAAYGNYNNTQITAVLNTPVNENLGLRFGVNWDHRDSFLKAGQNLNANLNPFKDNLSFRASSLLKFDNGELVIRADYSQMKGISTNTLSASNFYSGYTAAPSIPTGQTTNPLITSPNNPVYIANGRSNDQLLTLTPTTADGFYNLSRANNLHRDSATYGVMGEFKYDFGFFTLNYVGSYREFKRHEGNYSYYATGFAPNRFDGWYWQNSQELRLSTNGTGPIRAQVGAYYFKERADIALQIFDRVVNGVRTNPGDAGYLFAFPQNYVMSSSAAAFGQVTYSPIDTLHITAGARYTADEKARNGYTVTCAYDLNCAAAGDIKTPNIADRKYKKATWKVGVDYQVTPATMLYGTISTGYKAGGFNDGCETGTGTGCVLPASTLYYQPETLTAYEIGAKTALFDKRLRLNVSAFHYAYNNLQLTQVGPYCANQTQCTQTTNAASAKVDGIEVEANAAATQHDRIDFSLSYLNARYGNFLPSTAYPNLNFAGLKLDRSPTLTLMGGITHTEPLSNGGDIVAGIRTRYSSSYKMVALAIYGQFNQPSYTATEATLTYNAPEKRYYIQGFVKNIENNLLVTAVGGGVNGTLQVSDPRTYGVRGGIKF